MTEEDKTNIEADVLAQLGDEYKILQDKIDKIGAFRFTIKGWSITAIVASIVAGSAARVSANWFWAIAVLIFLFFFFIIEREQTNNGHRFGQRASLIESTISRLLKNAAHRAGNAEIEQLFPHLRFVPGIAHHLRDRRVRQHRERTFWRTCVDADVYFYVIQALVVIVFAIGQHTLKEPNQSGGTMINISRPAAVLDMPPGATPGQQNTQNKTAPGTGSRSHEKSQAQKDKTRSN